MSDKELALIEKKDISPIERDILKLIVKDEKSKEKASGYLNQANKALKSVVAYKERKTKPLNETLKIIRAETKPIETRLEAIISTLRRGLTDYQTAEQKKIDDKATQIAARVRDGKGGLKAETAMSKIEELGGPSKVVATDTGAVSFRKSERLEIYDADKLPRFLLVPDEAAIKRALKDGIEVPGARIVIDQVPVSH